MPSEKYFDVMAKCLSKEVKLDNPKLTPNEFAKKGQAILDLEVIGRFRNGFDGDSHKFELASDQSRSKALIHTFKKNSVIELLKLDDPNVVAPEDDSDYSDDEDDGDNQLHADRISSMRGMIVDVKSRSVMVVLFSPVELKIGASNLWIRPGSDAGSFKKMRWAIEHMKAPYLRGPVADLMLGVAKPKIAMVQSEQGGLNDTQHAAMQYAIGSSLAIIHGPPGTGKTKTISELIRRLVSRGERILVCGPTNASVDAMLERLKPFYKQFPERMLRLGHPARISDPILSHSLELLAARTGEGRVIKELIRTCHKRKAKARSSQIRQQIKSELRNLNAKWEKLLMTFLPGAKVIGATLHHGGAPIIAKSPPLFDTLIIDEVSQALLPQTWIPAVADIGIERLVVAGDNQQLSPTIKSRNPMVRKVLERSLFDILIDYHGEGIKHMLKTQYRMGAKIMELPAMALYNNELVADSTNANQSLEGLPGLNQDVLGSLARSQVYWIATSSTSAEFNEQRAVHGSITNPAEAQLIRTHVEKLLRGGIQVKDIGVMSPYSAQVRLLKELLPAEMAVNTIDGFQGQEREAIILSLVRNNSNHEVGFVRDHRRINVAITRAKRHLCVVGDPLAFSQTSPFHKCWIDWTLMNADISWASSKPQCAENSINTEAENLVEPTKNDEVDKSESTGLETSLMKLRV